MCGARLGGVCSGGPRAYRPAEVDALCGDASLIADEVGWKPSVSFESLIAEMVESDLKYLAN